MHKPQGGGEEVGLHPLVVRFHLTVFSSVLKGKSHLPSRAPFFLHCFLFVCEQEAKGKFFKPPKRY